MKGAYGIKMLKRVVKEIQNMTSEEYNALYERCKKECLEILDSVEGDVMGKESTTGDSLLNQVVCPCCHGCGYQHNIQTNINEPCRCCDGNLREYGNIEIKTSSTEIKE